jgi:hypothetical protein
LNFILFLSVSAWATSDILMLGNSYTSFNQLDSVVAQVFEAGGETTDVHSLTSGGLTLAEHATRAQDKTSPWYEMLVSDNKQREWVILQDQSQIPSFPQHNSDWLAGTNHHHYKTDERDRDYRRHRHVLADIRNGKRHRTTSRFLWLCEHKAAHQPTLSIDRSECFNDAQTTDLTRIIHTAKSTLSIIEAL